MANKEIGFNDFVAGLETVTDENGTPGIALYSFEHGQHEVNVTWQPKGTPVALVNFIIQAAGTLWQACFYAGYYISYAKDIVERNFNR